MAAEESIRTAFTALSDAVLLASATGAAFEEAQGEDHGFETPQWVWVYRTHMRLVEAAMWALEERLNASTAYTLSYFHLGLVPPQLSWSRQP